MHASYSRCSSFQQLRFEVYSVEASVSLQCCSSMPFKSCSLFNFIFRLPVSHWNKSERVNFMFQVKFHIERDLSFVIIRYQYTVVCFTALTVNMYDDKRFLIMYLAAEMKSSITYVQNILPVFPSPYIYILF